MNLRKIKILWAQSFNFDVMDYVNTETHAVEEVDGVFVVRELEA